MNESLVAADGDGADAGVTVAGAGDVAGCSKCTTTQLEGVVAVDLAAEVAAGEDVVDFSLDDDAN